MGVGEGGEGFPYMASGDYAVDRQQLISYGYSPSAWAVWREEMMTCYQASFSFATVIYPLNGLGTDPMVGKPVQVEVAAWAASQVMGLGQQGLEPGSDSLFFSLFVHSIPRCLFNIRQSLQLAGEHPKSREISRRWIGMGLALSNGICEMQSIPLIKRFSPSGSTWLIVSVEEEQSGGWFLT